MERGMTWLSTSLFRNRSNWHELMTNAIISFVKQAGLLQGYTVELNYLSGENIRLSLLVDDKKAHILTAKVDQYFKQYFSNLKPEANRITLPADRVFMPFPVNTIQYGLYPVLKIKKSQVKDHLVAINISQIILDALKDEEIDDETILTFAFYLQMGLIKAIDSSHEGFIAALRDIHKNRAPAVEVDQVKYQESRETLLDITRDIMQDNDAALPEWFGEWLNIYKEDSAGNNDVNAAYNNIVYSIYKHLGMGTKMISMLSYFIKTILLDEDVFTCNG